MMKKIDITIIVVSILFLCWYLPVAYYNVYACDDYWFGTNVRINGFWGNQLFYYFNWEGSYTHTFFASLPHAFSGEHIPFLCNMYSLTLLYFSLLFFLRTYTSLTLKRGLACSLYFLAFMYLCTKGDSEIRFWVCANITYVSEMSFLLIFMGLYHRLCDKSSRIEWLLVIICLFLIGGSKLTFIVYAISSVIIHNVLHNRIVNKNTILVLFVLIVFAIINITAPGNYIRLAEETIPQSGEEQMTILESLFYRIKEMEPFFFYTVLLLPISTHWSAKYSYKRKQVLMAMSIFIVTYILDSVIMYICFKDPGPLRIYFVAEVILGIFVLFGLNHFYTTILKQYYYVGVVSMALLILIAISNISLMYQVPGSIDFSKKARERDLYVMSCDADETIMILPLPSSYLLLSYFSNDKIWLERIYLPYFQKKNNFILLKSDDKEKIDSQKE